MKIVLNQQGFAHVTLSETTVTTGDGVAVNNTDSNGQTTVSGDSLTSSSSSATVNAEATEPDHKDAAPETDTTDSVPTDGVATDGTNTDGTNTEGANVPAEGDNDQVNTEGENPTEGAENAEGETGTGDGTGEDATVAPEGETSEGDATAGSEGEVIMDGGGYEGGYAGDDMAGMPGMEGASTQKSSVMASWPFVIGISSATLVVSIVIGILLAKKRIKKGFDAYED